MNIALWTRGRATALRVVLALALALCTGAGIASAAPRAQGFGQPVPVIDGNGNDIINFATGGIDNTSCSINIDDLRDDIAIADPKIVVCAPQEDTSVPPDGINDYFINGFDLRKFVLVYDRPNQNLYILWRTEGIVGDVDGNLNPDNANCVPAASFADEPGIGSQENYQARIDTNCDNIPDVIISVGGVLGTDVISVQGATSGPNTLAYRAGAGTGKDLELKISNISLPAAFTVLGNTNASFDGLGEDISAKATCGVPNPSIDVEKTVNVPTICPGGTADFTVVVTNTGNVPLTGISVVDNLPAGLVYQSTQSNTCGGGVNANGSQITYGPFDLGVGASCTIVIRVGRTAECAGEKINNVAVEGTFQSPCFNAGQPVTVSDKDAISVLCGNVVCSIDAPDTHVCPGETVQICGPEGGYSYLWNTGATTRCITVGAGTYSLVVTEIASGCSSTNPCAVTIIEDPRPSCSISAPDTRVCPGETVEICGPAGDYTYLWNTGATTRCITVGAGTYSLVITSTVTGCVSNNPCTVTITPDPLPECSITSDKDNVCKNETAELCGPVGPYTYLWNTGATTRCINVGAGTYSLVITNTETHCVSNNTCTKTIGVRTPPCVEVTVDAPPALCPGAAFELCGTVKNCGVVAADLEVSYGGVVRSFPGVPAGESRNYCIPAVMPACTGGSQIFTVNAKASNDCGDATTSANDSVVCNVPQIDVEKVALEATVVNGGTIHYTITVRNPSSTVALTNVTVVDDLCAYAKWTGVASPTPSSAPAVGTAGGIVTWTIGNLAPLASVDITFQVTADIAAGGGTCPTTVQCQNDVYATGICAGGGADSVPVRDDDSITTPITCAGEACPRTVGFWGAQCAQKGNGSTKFTVAQMTQISECVDNRSAFFNWAAGTDFEQFCRHLSTANMTQRVQAKRQFAGMLANVCTDALNLQPSQGGKIFLDESTPVHCSGLNATTIGALIDEVDAILAELEGQSLNDGAVKARYGQLISCLDGINNGVIIDTREDCEHGGTVPSNEGGAVGDEASIDAGASVELYRPSPNPFSGATSFAYKVDAAQASVSISVYDVAGRQIRNLVSGVQTAGQHTASWDGRTDSGLKATRGVYFVRTVIAGVKANTSRVLYVTE